MTLLLRKLAKLLSYILLTFLALLLFIPMFWMVLSAFAPQSELQTDVPMGDAFKRLSLRTFHDPAEFKSWTSAYLTTENFLDPPGEKRAKALFNITAMPRKDFYAAPVHRWLFKSAAALSPAVHAATHSSEPLLAGRLILWFENTLFIAGMVTLLSVLFNAMAGYAFAKINFPLRRLAFILVIGTIMIPGQVTVVPLFFLFTHGLGWYDSFWAVILPQVAAPVGIFLMKQYMQSLPSQLEDAARIDGCTEIGIFRSVILPLSKPILAVWAIFTFIGAWKAFLWPLIIIDDQNMYMLEVGLKTLQFSAGPRNVGVVMSAAFLASIPMVLIFFAFQRHLTKGLTVGGVKG